MVELAERSENIQLVILDARKDRTDNLKNILGGSYQKITVADNAVDLFNKTVSSRDFALFLVSADLPDQRGVDVCKKLKQIKPYYPVILYSDIHSEVVECLSFKAGVDDYLDVRCSSAVLLARVQARLKEYTRLESAYQQYLSQRQVTYRFYLWSFSSTSGQLRYGDQSVSLTKNEVRLLTLFVKKDSEVLSREAIGVELGFKDDAAGLRAVDVAVSRLRKKLETIDQVNHIKSVRNKGYLFVTPVKKIY
ncbi:response regulator transcription factor [Thiotrichales bacterium 19S9-12]|nr:response regulator transcription factor [Thiotrichales bacterium 19S9-11]MCF6811254.1 response regulator transcription factor [Thiotrichales bacterium 19S9-12]